MKDNIVDFIITWVDNNDPLWQKDFEYYSVRERRTGDRSAARYRNWNTLRYWFRGVERFAPWVNKIFFVTYGHLPDWLDTTHPKLQIVRHEDFIPAEYLPTFNSNVIEFFFHKIKGLSDRFVYFNDDTFIIDYILPERFFMKGLPCDIGSLTTRVPDVDYFPSMIFLTVGIINQHFNKKEVIKKNYQKWYNVSYMRASLHNLLQIRRTRFYGLWNHHLPQGYLRKTYDEVWSQCENDLLRTSLNRFRSYGDVSSWLIRYWQLASGYFSPYNVKIDSISIGISDESIDSIGEHISQQKVKLICLNDIPVEMNFESNKRKILNSLDSILPNKCSFEL